MQKAFDPTAGSCLNVTSEFFQGPSRHSDPLTNYSVTIFLIFERLDDRSFNFYRLICFRASSAGYEPDVAPSQMFCVLSLTTAGETIIIQALPECSAGLTEVQCKGAFDYIEIVVTDLGA
jgi:hypothetical protein